MTGTSTGGSQMVKYCLAEFFGTAALVFFAAGAVMVSTMLGGLPGPLIGGVSSGLILMILIWALFDISGAHLNPALTVTLALFGDFPKNRVPAYVVAQMAGSAAGGALLYFSLGSHGAMGANLPNTAIGITPGNAFILEIFLSFLMMLVIRGSFAAGSPLRQFAAVPIGAIVGIEVMLMGPVAGAAMNPARAFGPYVFLGDWQHYWIYVAGPLAGIIAGAVVWKVMTSPADA
jgi:MIP family channel proteins